MVVFYARARSGSDPGSRVAVTPPPDATLVSPPPGATLVALAVPFFVSAGAVQGTALALARSGVELYYLVDNATVGGPPVWVQEGEVEQCVLAPVIVRRD